MISILFLFSGIAQAAQFSLYGVTLGMTRTEVDEKWKRLDENKYYVEESILLNINPVFDHEERLYQLGFSIPVPLLDQYPAPFVNTSLQELVQEMWAGPTTAVSVRIGRGTADITILDKTRQGNFITHINEQMSLQLSILLKP